METRRPPSAERASLSGDAEERRSDSLSLIVSISLLLLIAIAFFAAVWTTDARWWGFNYPAFLSPVERVPLSLLPLALAVPIAWSMRRARSRPVSILHQFLPIGIPVISLLLWIFHDTTHLLGDGILIENVTRSGSLFTRSSPLANRLFIWVFQFFGDPAEGARRTLELFSVALGPIYLALSWLVVRELVTGSLGRLAAFFIFVFQPTLLAYAGYIEFYPVIWLSIMLVLYLALLSMRGALPFRVALTAAIVAVAIHVPILIVLPPMVIAFIRAERIRGNSPRQITFHSIRHILIAVVAAGLILAALGITPKDLAGALLGDQGTRFLRLGETADIRFPYTLFSGEHLTDLLNEIVLVMPLLLLLPIWLIPRRSILGDPPVLLLGTLGILALIPFIAMKAGLGFACDWDLKAIPAIPFQLLGINLIFRGSGRRPGRGEEPLDGEAPPVPAVSPPVPWSRPFSFFIALLICIGLTRTIAWIHVNHDRSTAIARIESIAEEENLNSPFARSYIYERLKGVHEEAGNIQEAYRAIQKSAALRPDEPRLATMAGYLAIGNRLPGEGEHHFRSALRTDPGFLPAAIGIGVVHLLKNDLVEAESSFRHALLINRGDSQATRYLAVVLIRQGRSDEVLREIGAIPRFAHGQPSGSQLDQLVPGLERGGFPEEAAEVRRLLSARETAGER